MERGKRKKSERNEKIKTKIVKKEKKTIHQFVK